MDDPNRDERASARHSVRKIYRTTALLSPLCTICRAAEGDSTPGELGSHRRNPHRKWNAILTCAAPAIEPISYYGWSPDGIPSNECGVCSGMNVKEGVDKFAGEKQLINNRGMSSPSLLQCCASAPEFESILLRRYLNALGHNHPQSGRSLDIIGHWSVRPAPAAGLSTSGKSPHQLHNI